MNITISQDRLQEIIDQSVQRTVVQVLRKKKYDVSLMKELQWLEEGEETLKKRKGYANVKKLMADSLR